MCREVLGSGFGLKPKRGFGLSFADREVLALEMKEKVRFFFFFITLGLELSDTKVYEP